MRPSPLPPLQSPHQPDPLPPLGGAGMEDEPLSWLFHQAERALGDGDDERAIPIYEKLIAVGRGEPEVLKYAHLRLAEVFARRHQYARLKRHSLAAIALDPDNAELRFELGQRLLGLRKSREALASFRAAVERQPNNSLYQLHYAATLNKLGRSDDADRVFRRALAQDPHHPPLLRAFALSLLDRHLLSEAEVVLQKALQLAPNDPETLSTFSLWQFLRGKTVAAVPPPAEPRLPPPAAESGKASFSMVVYEDAHWIEEEDRRLAYEEYVQKKPAAAALSWSEWRALDQEASRLFYWSMMRDLKAAETDRLEQLRTLLLI